MALVSSSLTGTTNLFKRVFINIKINTRTFYMGQRNLKKYYYLYKITNLINGKYYYGMHSTNDLDDNYMGSGKLLKEAYNKYGIENFKKEIIQYCDSFDELSNLEKTIVNELLIKDPNCYNLIEGGYYITEEQLKKIGEFNSRNQRGENNSAYGKIWMTDGIKSEIVDKSKQIDYENLGWKKGRILKKSEKFSTAQRGKVWVYKENETHHIYLEDLQDYLDKGYTRGRCKAKAKTSIPKELFLGSMKGKVVVRDQDGNKLVVNTNDERYLNGTLIPFNKGKTLAEDKNGNRLMVYVNDKRLLTGELTKVKYNVKAMTGKVTAKDINGNIIVVDKNDDRLLTGELVGANKGKHWKQNI